MFLHSRNWKSGVGLWLGLALFPACGPSNLAQKFVTAAKKQNALDTSTSNLFARSPSLDSGNPNITAADDIENSVKRSMLTFTGLVHAKEAIQTKNILFYDAASTITAPTFFQWAGNRVPWDTSDFRIFMAAYYSNLALTKALETFPTLDYGKKITTGSGAKAKSYTQYTVYANEPGDPFATGYDPTRKAVTFYRLGGTTSYAPFNAADEPEAIVHEFGHAVMHLLNSDIVTLAEGSNPDLDAIQEALSDFFGATVMRDDRILGYLAANYPGLTPTAKSRTGSKYVRSLVNSISFPSAYRDLLHLDGRVLASALNDFRKYLTGVKVKYVSGCAASACDIAPLGSSVALTDAVAWDLVFKIAYTTFKNEISTTSTMQKFAKSLVSVSSDLATSLGSYKDTATTVFANILVARGLISSQPVELASSDIDAMTFGPDAVVNDFVVDPITGYMPFPDDTGFANTNATVEPCEVLIFPKLKNNTNASGHKASAINSVRIELDGVTGFTEFLHPTTQKAIDSLSSKMSSLGVVSYPTKLMGWLEPGEISTDLITSPTSRWYTETGDTTFARPLSATQYPSPVGFLVRAPRTVGTPGVAKFRISFYANNTQGPLNRISSDFIETSLSVSGTSTAFCTGR